MTVLIYREYQPLQSNQNDLSSLNLTTLQPFILELYIYIYIYVCVGVCVCVCVWCVCVCVCVCIDVCLRVYECLWYVCV